MSHEFDLGHQNLLDAGPAPVNWAGVRRLNRSPRRLARHNEYGTVYKNQRLTSRPERATLGRRRDLFSAPVALCAG